MPAQDASWDRWSRAGEDPGKDRLWNYNDPSYWEPKQVPRRIAFFRHNYLAIYFNISTTIGTWKFLEGDERLSNQPVWFYNGENNQICALTFTGQGIINDADSIKVIIQNNSQATINFTSGSVAGTRQCPPWYGCTEINNSGHLYFKDKSSAGVSTINNLGFLSFSGDSTAYRSTITNNAPLIFTDRSTAGNATITNQNGPLTFDGSSTVGNATITNQQWINFTSHSTAGNSVINNAGAIYFRNNSRGSSATINNAGKVFFEDFTILDTVVLNNTSADAVVDLSSSKVNRQFESAASIAGGGTFLLGASVFRVSSNKDSTVTGAISDGGQFGGKGAVFVKEGTGKLTLDGKNTWTGETFVSGGTLVANGKTLRPGRYGPPPGFLPK
jgi:autotransporter-associated beta strand protein